ncbi:MAG: UbiD family decarboxylase [Planctomycetota bacterium]|nr:MAG: UbiD family decarboxylase [Planctomycetota bacterium]
MAYKSLADFLEELLAVGELVRVSAEVDPHVEIAEITRRVAAEGGPALLFDRVQGQSTAVVTNLLGTQGRACRAVGVECLDEIAPRIESLVAQHTPQNWFDRLKMSPEESGAEKFRPKPTKTGVCQQVVHLGRDVNIAAFPLLTAWPAESGPAITGGILVTADRQTHTRAATIAPMVACDESHLAVADAGDSPFARHWADYQAAGERMPAAVLLGGDPAATVAATVPLPAEVDTYHMAGLLRGKPLDVVKCRTHEVEVPAEVDLVFEGYFDPEVPPTSVTVAAPGASHYREPSPAPVFHVAAITHRSQPIFPAIVDGGLRGEAGVLAAARERMLLPALQAAAPDVVDVHLPPLGGLERFALVSFRKRYPYHARQVAAALWGTNAVKFVRYLILLDDDANVRDLPRVLERVGANAAPERDLFALDGPAGPADLADAPGSPGRRLAIDATAKLDAERPTASPPVLDVGEETRRLVASRWGEYGLKTPGGL